MQRFVGGISVLTLERARAPNGGLWDIHTFRHHRRLRPPASTTLQLEMARD